MNKNMLWMVLGCAGLAVLLWLFLPAAGGASWLVFLMPVICIFGHCLPSLFMGKKSCHSKTVDEAGKKEAKSCH